MHLPKTWLCCTREKERERSGIERECGRHEGEDPGNPIPWLRTLICHLEGLVCWGEGGDTVLLPSQMINLQNKFSTPSRLQFRLLALHITLASMCIVPSYRNTWRTSLCLCKRIFSTKKHDGYICWIATFLSEPCLIACPLSSFKLTHSCCWDFDVNVTLAVADIVSGDVWRWWCLVAVCW